MYKFSILDGKVKGTMKGIKRNVAEDIKLEDYKNCIFSDDKNLNKTTCNFNLIKSSNHILKSINITKTSLSSYDDKRYYLDNINSLSYGHFRTLNN
jgi:uncharacterized membrane protein